GATIADSGLLERDIVVLTLTGGGKVISNPRHERVLEKGHRILCYGKLESMRAFLPEKRKRRRSIKVRSLPMEHATEEAGSS
ncbi:MAG: hypothetical protein KDA28_06165, partial [Phycisphaerales bacterium]|nr:hypothetical protein [Phycisphaerales bacterium]